MTVKGAPDVVLELCNRYQTMDNTRPTALDDAARGQILAANDRMTKDALRVLGVAYRVVASNARPDSTARSWRKTWSSPAWWA